MTCIEYFESLNVNKEQIKFHHSRLTVTRFKYTTILLLQLFQEEARGDILKHLHDQYNI